MFHNFASKCLYGVKPDLDPGEGCDLGAGGDQDVLGVDDLLAAVSCYGHHLVLTGHLPKTVDMGHLRRVMSRCECCHEWKSSETEILKHRDERSLTLFCLNRCAIPPVSAFTAPLF